MKRNDEMAIDRAMQRKVELSKQYGVPISSIVWMGGNHYIIVKDSQEIKV